jgi:hypothetical protein
MIGKRGNLRGSTDESVAPQPGQMSGNVERRAAEAYRAMGGAFGEFVAGRLERGSD